MSVDYLTSEPSVDIAFTGFKSFTKLLFIVASYSAAFITLVQFGFWMFEVRQSDCTALIWYYGGYCDNLWTPERVARVLAVDFALLVLFVLQHTLMTGRKLVMTKYWDILHYEWEIDKAVYNIMTAFTLQAVINLWQPVGVSVWEISFFNHSPYLYHFMAHVIAWGIFYGTNLMVDLPDLIGLNQVGESSNKVIKSPELRQMMQYQRHMGMLPIAVILIIHPCMSADRFLLAFVLLSYMYLSWRSRSCYPYAKSMKRVKRHCEYFNED